ncbi:MAG TPA: bifunctional 5,10-methylenetetrahydrofolate dehydrogenase/5,10-methenyltetrahydrofolate cyclohydrolase [Candidatus Aminicenantes bacterium]|nr:bifunctional 5,10-methylenetetrahydrofolate dehydrogenase/5,10-methenyltetrahydrofolate cyclohydrolase [Candidatus Aminicenantes bacterium]
MGVLDGQALAVKIREQVGREVTRLREATNRTPGLTVLMVGDDPASRIYVRTKHKVAEKLGIRSDLVILPGDASQTLVLERLRKLNRDDDVDAVLVQIPLPAGLDTWAVLDEIDPRKDVDRFHPLNLGRVMTGEADLFPCTPAGVLRLLDHHGVDLKGINAVVVGRSFIVGKPLAAMLTNHHATVTVCHTRTRDLAARIREAELVVAAAGQPGIIKADMVCSGAVLVDVGTTFLDQREEVERLCPPDQLRRFERKGNAIAGDIHWTAWEKSAWYTPVPGGIGPMTVAMLMENTLELFRARGRRLQWPGMP